MAGSPICKQLAIWLLSDYFYSPRTIVEPCVGFTHFFVDTQDSWIACNRMMNIVCDNSVITQLVLRETVHTYMCTYRNFELVKNMNPIIIDYLMGLSVHQISPKPLLLEP